MKKIILSLVATFIAVSAMAHVLTITLSDGTVKVITTSELKSINIDGQKITAVAYDGSIIEGLANIEVQSIEMDDKAHITDIISKTISFDYSGITLGKRDIKMVNYVYPSVDPMGDPITLSATILIPDEIYDGTKPSDGILLYNHYTLCDKNEAPTLGTFSCEAVLLGSFLKPNYIMVESDFYGFGATERFPQAYLYGQTNAKASIDAYNAALDILEELQIEKGKYLFNLGYSSAGYDALAVLKEVDTNHHDIIKFDKTFSGGGPYDLPVVYTDYIEKDSILYLCAVPLMISSFNESAKLGLDYSTIFQSPLAENIYDWVIDMNYDSWTINGKIGAGTLVSEMLQPVYCDMESEESKQFMELFKAQNLSTAWEPDPESKIFLLHSRDDDYVTFGAARSITDFLTSKGFQKSIVPGRTNLETNLVLKKLGHIYAMIVWLAQTSAEIKAWPVIFATPESEAAFYEIVNRNLSIGEILDFFNAMGLNANDVIYVLEQYLNKEGESSGDILKDDIYAMLAYLGISPEEFSEMADDSGIDIHLAYAQLKAWLKTHPGVLTSNGGGDAEAVMRRISAEEDGEPNLIRAYKQQLMDSYRQSGVLEKAKHQNSFK